MTRLMLPLLALLLTPATATARLRAGAASTDITPVVWPVRLIGNFGITLSREAHDALHARALVLEESGVKVAIALVDSCYVKREELDRIKASASRRTGIPVNRILISATHTHSAPPSRAAANNPQEADYVERLITQTAEAITLAHTKLEPARIGWAVTPLGGELFNRRWFMRPGTIPPDPYGVTTDVVRMNPPAASPDLQHPAGGTDPAFSVLSVQTAAGQPLALIGNYSLHYVGGVPGNSVSADYFGEFSRQVAEKLSGAVVMLTNGTSGDVNNIDFVHPRPRQEPFARIREVASQLATLALDAAARIQYQQAVPIRTAETELVLRYRRPTAGQLAFARQALAAPQDQESTLPRNAKAYAERALALQAGPAQASIQLQALRLGELGIAAIPFEVFTETGLTLKELSPFPTTFTIELANGHYGYLPTPRHFALGGYETWLGTSNMEVEASTKITRALLELLGRLR